MAQMITDNMPGVSAVAEVTGAAAENMGLLSRGDSDFALTPADIAFQAYNHSGSFTERGFDGIRAIASVYPGALHLVTLAGSQVHSLDDLKGKRVSVGGPGSGTELHAKIALEANGITFDDFSAQRLNFNETADAIRDGDVDAGFIASVLPPTSSIMSLATTRDISLISLSDDEVANIQKVEPVFASYELMPGVYEGVEDTIQTVEIPNLFVTSSNVDEDLVYEVTKMLYEKTDQLGAIHPAARQISTQYSVDSMPIPFHAGAIRYYNEIGVNLKEHHYP